MANEYIDIKLTKDEDTGIYDISFENGDFKLVDNLETSLQMSIFNEVRADASEVPAPERRRGWWGNVTNMIEGDQIGSKLWLLEQERRTPTTLSLAIKYLRDALQHYIDEGLATSIEVNGEFLPDSGIRLFGKIFRPQDRITTFSYNLWENVNEI